MTSDPNLPPIRVAELSGREPLVGFAESWRALFDATPDATPFDSLEWLEPWRRHRGRGEPLLLVAYEGDEPIAAMALMRMTRPFSQLRWMGAPESDYRNILGGRRRDECAAAFLSYLEERPGWRLCDLGGLSPQSLELLSAGLGEVSIESEPGAALPLPAGREAFERAMSGNLRSSIKRKNALLKEQYGDFSFSTVHDVAALPDAMEDLFRLHTARLNEKGDYGAFVEAGARQFHREAAENFSRRGWLRLHRLCVRGSCVATLYCFHLRDVTYYYLGGFDPAFARYSPGTLIINYAILSAIDEGAREFDFMRGAEEYKSRWKAESRASGRIVFGQSGPVAQAALAARRLQRMLCRLLREGSVDGARGAVARWPHSSKTPSSA